MAKQSTFTIKQVILKLDEAVKLISYCSGQDDTGI